MVRDQNGAIKNLLAVDEEDSSQFLLLSPFVSAMSISRPERSLRMM